MIPSFQEFWPKRSIQKLIQKSKSETDPGARLSRPGVFTIQHNSCTHLYRFYVGISGFLHFYSKKFYLDIAVSDKCQCPTSGFLHFYKISCRNTSGLTCVSMPCFGLSPFLQPRVEMEELLVVRGVNALLRAFSISTQSQENGVERKLVSMPCFGLSPFLRYPSGNPLFMRLPGSIFASNSQNILKTCIFSSFFGLVCIFLFSNTFSGNHFVCYTSRI